MDLFKKKEDGPPADVKEIRHRLLQFIKSELQKVEAGEGRGIRGIQLYLAPAEAGRHLYEAAVYVEEQDRLREEVQRIADDYALDLPEGWTLDASFLDSLPEGVARSADLPVALRFSGRPGPVEARPATAIIRVLHGEAEAETYAISSAEKVYIGREAKVQTADGFYRINSIAFPAGSTHDANRYISRQHAHIEWDAETGSFLLFADEGGVPPRNKVKVRPPGGSAVKLQTTEVGYTLGEGDQIILGESALLEFRYG